MAQSLDWKKLHSRHLYQSRGLSLRADTCQMPNGKIIQSYYVIEHPDWVNVIALTPQREVILIKQYRHGLQRTLLEFPGGDIEESDVSPLEAIKRELWEETGYSSNNFIALGSISANPVTHNNLTHCFLATHAVQSSTQHLDGQEQIEVVLMPFEQVIEIAMSDEFCHALHLGALFRALKMLGKI